MSEYKPTIKSPCQKICQIDLQKGYCTGCMRTLDEIAAWPTLDDEEKIRILKQTEKRLKKG
jgi:predicted Fe-S protein YdhL (DUF1289 family)